MQGRTGFRLGGYPPGSGSHERAQGPAPTARVLTSAGSGFHGACCLLWESRGDSHRLPGKRFLGGRPPFAKGCLPQASHVTSRPLGTARRHHPPSAAGAAQGRRRRALAAGAAEGLDLLPQWLQRCQAGGALGLRDENINRGGWRIQLGVAETPRRQTARILSQAIVGTRVIVAIAGGFGKVSGPALVTTDSVG
jgi:hypothetical protein